MLHHVGNVLTSPTIPSHRFGNDSGEYFVAFPDTQFQIRIRAHTRHGGEIQPGLHTPEATAVLLIVRNNDVEDVKHVLHRTSRRHNYIHPIVGISCQLALIEISPQDGM